MKTINLYYEGELLDNKHTKHLASTILSLGLREGDEIVSYPFKEEKGSLVKEKNYQYEPLKIASIRYNFEDYWNGLVKTEIDITLVKNT